MPSRMTDFGSLPSKSRDMGAGTGMPPIPYHRYHNTSSEVNRSYPSLSVGPFSLTMGLMLIEISQWQCVEGR